ncbi:MAG TPA: hypothetical protein VHL10_01065 [Nitrososphaera sp.]|jgi:hypothetical protein|nr:hypothetical protein [Nitrososphaera sp.]
MSIIDEINALETAVVQKPAPIPAPELKDVTQEVQPMNPQWARFRDQFAEAMKGGLYTIDGLEKSIQQGKTLFFPGINAAVVGERQVYDSGMTIFQVTWSVGDMSEIKALAPGIESVARLLGCEEMLIEGRLGWQRALKDIGYGPWSVTLRKKL